MDYKTGGNDGDAEKGASLQAGRTGSKKTPKSRHERKHFVTQVLCGVQVMTWLIGAEVLCLYGQACAFPQNGAQDDRVPVDGAMIMLPASIAILAVVLPLGVYLQASEQRQNVAVWALLAGTVAVFLLTVAVMHFIHAGNSNSPEELGKAHVGFAVVFLLASLGMGTMSAVAVVLLNSLPSSYVQPHRFVLLPLEQEPSKRKRSKKQQPLRDSSSDDDL